MAPSELEPDMDGDLSVDAEVLFTEAGKNAPSAAAPHRGEVGGVPDRSRPRKNFGDYHAWYVPIQSFSQPSVSGGGAGWVRALSEYVAHYEAHYAKAWHNAHKKWLIMTVPTKSAA